MTLKEQSGLSRAYLNLHAAENLLRARTDDEFELNLVGYHLQQALEMAMKYVITNSGMKTEYTHELFSIYSARPELFDSMSDKLKSRFDTITSWESKTRYLDNYLIENNAIQEIMPLVREYLAVVSESSMVPTTSEFI